MSYCFTKVQYFSVAARKLCVMTSRGIASGAHWYNRLWELHTEASLHLLRPR